jgi:RNA polymerase sigma factor (sigma-70 family)
MNIRRTFTDAALLEILRSDESPDDAIRFLYITQFDITTRYVNQNSGNDEDAQDIFQELVLVFIELVKKNKFRGESSVSTFLYALTRNIWLNELKKRNRAKLRDEKFDKQQPGTDMDVSHFIMHREMKTVLMRMVDNLGEPCKKILLAFYFDNLAMKDILLATAYDNEQVVRNKKYKCLKQLEELIAGKPELAKNLKSVLSYE